jgi:hypothetical protein
VEPEQFLIRKEQAISPVHLLIEKQGEYLFGNIGLTNVIRVNLTDYF